MKQDDLARALGTTQSSVSGWINGKYEPAAATVFTIEQALGIDPGTLSRPLGYLPVDPAARPVSVEAAIAQSNALDEESKSALTSVYRALANHSAASLATARRHRPVAAGRDRLASGAGAGAGRKVAASS